MRLARLAVREHGHNGDDTGMAGIRECTRFEGSGRCVEGAGAVGRRERIESALDAGRREKILEQIEDLNRTLRFIEYKCWFYDTASAAGTCEVPRKMPKEEMPPELLATLEECQIQGY